MTPTLAVTPTATSVPTASVRINEVLPAPDQFDWNHDGHADEVDEWIELTNTGAVTVDLGGWMLDDADDTPGHVFSASMSLQPGGLILLHRAQTGIVLDDEGDALRLLNVSRDVVDSVQVPPLPPDASYSRDLEGIWHADWLPSPGKPNVGMGGWRQTSGRSSHYDLIVPWPRMQQGLRSITSRKTLHGRAE
jgi:hypothetical protein